MLVSVQIAFILQHLILGYTRCTRSGLLTGFCPEAYSRNLLWGSGGGMGLGAKPPEAEDKYGRIRINSMKNTNHNQHNENMTRNNFTCDDRHQIV